MEEPTDRAINTYYTAHQPAYSTTSVHLRMISAPRTGNVKRMMADLRKELAADGDFAAAAKKHSDDSAASNGGDRGWVKRGDLREDLTNAALALEAGEVSEVIEDDTHCRLLKVEGRKEGEVIPLSEVRDEIVKTMMKEARKARIEGWIEEAKKDLKEVSPKNAGVKKKNGDEERRRKAEVDARIQAIMQGGEDEKPSGSRENKRSSPAKPKTSQPSSSQPTFAPRTDFIIPEKN